MTPQPQPQRQPLRRQLPGTGARPPGLHFEWVQLGRPATARPAHGVPCFVGFGNVRGAATKRRLPPALDVNSLEHFEACLEVARDSFLGDAVKGFFANGGKLCKVLPVGVGEGGAGLLEVLSPRGPLVDTSGIDLVAVPDASSSHAEGATESLHAAVLEHCESMGERFALLDAAPSRPEQPPSEEDLRTQAGRRRSAYGALYFPWLRIQTQPRSREVRFVPPCGHVAGVYARTDARVGVHKAPANEVVDGAIATQWSIEDALHSALNEAGINCIRDAHGRGIRIWGARTLGNRADWTYVPVVRTFLGLRRWLEHGLDDIVFESNTPELWRRVEQRLEGYGLELFAAGALAGDEPAQAFRVKCDAETNPPSSRDAGRLVADVGLATTVPAEFVVVRIVHDSDGVVLIGP